MPAAHWYALTTTMPCSAHDGTLVGLGEGLALGDDDGDGVGPVADGLAVGLAKTSAGAGGTSGGSIVTPAGIVRAGTQDFRGLGGDEHDANVRDAVRPAEGDASVGAPALSVVEDGHDERGEDVGVERQSLLDLDANHRAGPVPTGAMVPGTTTRLPLPSVGTSRLVSPARRSSSFMKRSSLGYRSTGISVMSGPEGDADGARRGVGRGEHADDEPRDVGAAPARADADGERHEHDQRDHEPSRVRAWRTDSARHVAAIACPYDSS